MTDIAFNKRALFDYHFLEHFEAGISLTGAEVKSIKTGHISLKGAFVTRLGRELILTNANIPQYKFAGNLKSYDPVRPRKILLRKSQINNLIGKMSVSGLTVVPLRVYTKERPASTSGDRSSTRGGLIKIEIALAKGKKEFDKRESIKKRDDDRKIKSFLKS